LNKFYNNHLPFITSSAVLQKHGNSAAKENSLTRFKIPHPAHKTVGLTGDNTSRLAISSKVMEIHLLIIWCFCCLLAMSIITRTKN